jgi:hypothetical protein
VTVYRSIKADKDNEITDRVIRGVSQTNANVGQAGTLNLYKLYGLNRSGSVPLNELTRLLVHFDLASLRQDLANGVFDVASSTFNCTLKLHDVYGGQTTPRNFTACVYPLSHSWDEGRGRDVVYYQDQDFSNFLTASYNSGAPTTWFASGANAKGLLGSPDIDVVTSASFGAGIVNLSSTQNFIDGTEDLLIDVTRIVSATLTNQLPDAGFRISFIDSEENDTRSRFVKRFGSRQSIDPSIRPELIVRYDNSRISHQSSFFFDSFGSVFLNNYVRGAPSNVVSGSSLTQITGSNCMLLKLWTIYSSSSGPQQYSMYVTASQHVVGDKLLRGVYSASFAVPSSDPRLTKLVSEARLTGSNTTVRFNEIWSSLDETVAFYSGTLQVKLPDSTVGSFRPRRYQVNIPNVDNEYAEDDTVRFRAFVFDRSNAFYKFVRVPQDEPSVNVEAHYSVRDVIADKTVIPFDRVYNSTRMSSDSEHLYFDVWMESLVPDRTYAIDMMLVDGDEKEIYYDCSPAFRVVPV